MKIAPLEIKQKTFETSFRGYDKDEVNAFLLSLSVEWERLLEVYKDLKMKYDTADKEVQKLREIESSLFKTLKTAENTGANIIEQANKTAELHIKEAQIKADVLINDAKDMVKEIRQDYRMIENYRDDLLIELKNLVNDTLEKVNKISVNTKQSSEAVRTIFQNNKNNVTQNNKPNEEIKENDIIKDMQKKSSTDNSSSFFDQIAE